VVQIVAFELDRQRFGLPTTAVERVLRAVASTPLPKAPPVIEGLINVAGAPVPVLDLRRRFGLPARPVHVDDLILLVRVKGRRIAVRADRVSGIVPAAPSDVRPPQEVAPMAAEVAGVLPLSDGVLLIHDPDAFLGEAEALELDGLVAGAAA
jgi:purine-binding chemotaxis protein CheW